MSNLNQLPAHFNNPAMPPAPVVDVPFRPVTLQMSEDQKMALTDLWRSIKKRRGAILALGAGAAILAAVVGFSMQPIYQSTATVMIEPGKGKILSIEDVYSEAAGQSRENYQTQVEILKSREVAVRTVKALKLWNLPGYDPRKAQDGLWTKIKATIGLGKPVPEWTEDNLADAMVDKFMEDVSVDPVRLSQLVKVSYDSPDPRLAPQVANALANAYIEADREARFNTSQQISSFLQDRLAGLRANLAKSESALQDFRDKNGIVDIGGSVQAVAGQQVAGTSQKLVEARSNRAELESIYQQIVKARGDYRSVPVVMRDPGVISTLAQYTVASQHLAELGARLGPAHTEYKTALAEVNQLQVALSAQRQAVVDGVKRDYDAAKANEDSLAKDLTTASADVQKLNRQEGQLAVLQREVASNQDLYNMFLARAKETNITSDVQAAVARVVDPAVVPDIPVKPRKVQLMLLALLMGLLLGAAVAVLLDRLDNTIKGGDDAEARLHVPLLTALPLVKDVSAGTTAHMFLEEKNSHFSEAVRTARTGIMLSSIDAAHKVMLITSTMPGEGKTTVATNLALAHAQTQRTLLIDADMRRPQVARRLGVPPGAKGLSNLVAGTAKMDECIHVIPGTPLYVMPVGDLPPNPLELLLSERFKALVKTLQAKFDLVMIDAPPIELVSDALVIAPLATNAVYVVKAMSTPAPLVRKSLNRLQRAGGSVLGIVLNQLDFAKAQAYHGEYGDYTYGGYGYSAKAEPDQLDADADKPVLST